MAVARRVPAVTEVVPVNELLAETARVPAPALISPPVPEMVAVTSRSMAAFVELPTVNVRFALPRLRLPERVEPSGLFVAE